MHYLSIRSATQAYQGSKGKVSLPPGRYWAQDSASGGVGYIILGPSGHVHAGAMVPQHIRAELLAGGLKQRNTQAELLAIWCLLLTEGALLKGQRVYIADDSTATLGNMLRQSAKSDDSRTIVGNIWLLAALMNVQLRIRHTPGCLNPGDPPSRAQSRTRK